MDYTKVLELQKVKIYKAQKRLGMDTPEAIEEFYALFNAGTSTMLNSKEFAEKCGIVKKEIFERKYRAAQAELERKNAEMAEMEKIKEEYEEAARKKEKEKQEKIKGAVAESLNLSAEEEKSLLDSTLEMESEEEQKQKIKRIKLEDKEGEKEKKSDGEKSG